MRRLPAALGSAFANRVGSPGLLGYAAASAALVGYSRGAARDVGPAGITLNVVQAGKVVLATGRIEASLAEAQGVSKALASCGRPEEIAAGIVFMASAGPSSTPARC
jgi:NAD(P)-dependent dehydrogenase (short-subunit alcohol dehydrogenase family)